MKSSFGKKRIGRKGKPIEDGLGHFTNIEETLNKSILVAQETAEELKGMQRKNRN